MTDSNHEKELAEKFLQSLNSVLENGQWEGSLFLENAKKKIISIRDEVQTAIEQTYPDLAHEHLPTEARSSTLEPTQEIYIYLYQAQAKSLDNWLTSIKSLDKLGITRPIYEDELSLQKFISDKENENQHGYAVAEINQSDILPSNPDTAKYDSKGNLLLMIRENGINLDKIKKFSHPLLGDFIFDGEKLIKQK